MLPQIAKADASLNNDRSFSPGHYSSALARPTEFVTRAQVGVTPNFRFAPRVNGLESNANRSGSRVLRVNRSLREEILAG